MNVLIADKLPDHARVRLAAGGCLVHLEPKLKGDALTERLRALQPDVLVVRSTQVTPAHLEAASTLSLVVRAGAGVNTIDLDACSQRGVFVANCPGKNAAAVAELTLGLLIAIDRHLPDGVADLRAGRWNKAAYSQASGLYGRTFGVLGCGAIGRAVTQRARAFGMRVVAWSRSLTDADAEALGAVRCATPEEVARQSDALSVHMALTPETRGFVGPALLDALPHGSVFLNTSRAELVQEDALLHALEHRALRAGLDVFAGEPSAKVGDFVHPLAQHPRVLGSHHIGASTAQAQEAVADAACAIIESYRDTGRVPNCVNLADRSSADHTLVVRHRDRVGVLADVLTELRKAHINVQEMENAIFTPGGGAIARIHLHGAPTEPCLAALRALPDLFAVHVFALETAS